MLGHSPEEVVAALAPELTPPDADGERCSESRRDGPSRRAKKEIRRWLKQIPELPPPPGFDEDARRYARQMALHLEERGLEARERLDLLRRSGKDPNADVKWLRLEIARQWARIAAAVAEDDARPAVYFEGYGRHTGWFVQETESLVSLLERRLDELLAARKPRARSIDPPRTRVVDPATMRDPDFDPFA
jgi:hypothetical protein